MRHYDVSEGLSSNSVKGMIQDERGYIWFATPDGLNVFNGKEFKSFGCSYQPDGAEGADAINILTILQHKDGKQIWAATHSSSLFLFNPVTGSFREILICWKKGTPMPNVCYSMIYDSAGRLWIGTDMGIWIYDEEQSSFSVFSTSNSNLPSDLIQCLHRDAEGVIWIGTDRGLVRFNPSAESFLTACVDSMDFGVASGLHISTIADGPSGNLWIGTWNNGLALFDKRLNIIRAVRPAGEKDAASTMRIRSILADNSDLLWLSANVGLFKYDIVDNKLSRVILSSSGLNNNFYSSLKDKEGGIWFGTFFQGAWYLSPRARQIECYTSENVESNFNGSAVSSFCEDKSGNVYIASENGGLSLFNPVQRTFIPLNYRDVGRNLHALCIMGDELFIGTFTQGLKIVNLKTGRVRSCTVADTPAIQSDNVFSLYGDDRGLVYIGTEQGCTVYETSSGKWNSLDELQGEFIYDIERDRNGDLWFASYYNGVYRYDTGKDRWTHYMHNDNKSGVLPSSKIIGLFTDDSANLWICTEGGGVCRYDYDADCFRGFSLKQDDREIRISLVYGILNDSCGRLWMSSNDGIYVCQENGEVIRHLTHEDGLQSDQYNFGAAYRSGKGQLYFGGVYGFNVINTDLIMDTNISPVATARIRYKDKEGNTIYSERVSSSSSVQLPGYVSSFTMDFECLSYLSPLKNRFAYKIDDKGDWLTTAESSVTFLNFPFGKHSVMVRCCNGEGCWSGNEVVFTIDNIPPFYSSTVAKVLYCVLAVLFLGAVIVLIIRRHDERSRARYAEMKAEKDREAYQAKIDFFTYVAHEIKTPVSLIKAPLENVLQNVHPEDEQHNLEIMLKNTDRLLNLVNQLLDFKKISSDGHSLKMMACDPAEVLLNVTNRFEGAMTGGLHISVNLPQARFWCLLDPEAFTKILSNLVSNAVQHAESVISVSLSVADGASAKSLRIEVRDD
ncbi:MAG: two-component regulator propeller domain-containing protein, partial [Candidatus Cryptobacteroides sp.]